MRPDCPAHLITAYVREHYDFMNRANTISDEVDRIQNLIEQDGHGYAPRAAILTSVAAVRTERSSSSVAAGKSIPDALADIVADAATEISEDRLNGYYSAFGFLSKFLGELQAEGIIEINGGIDLTYAAPRR